MDLSLFLVSPFTETQKYNMDSTFVVSCHDNLTSSGGTKTITKDFSKSGCSIVFTSLKCHRNTAISFVIRLHNSSRLKAAGGVVFFSYQEDDKENCCDIKMQPTYPVVATCTQSYIAAIVKPDLTWQFTANSVTTSFGKCFDEGSLLGFKLLGACVEIEVVGISYDAFGFISESYSSILSNETDLIPPLISQLTIINCLSQQLYNNVQSYLQPLVTCEKSPKIITSTSKSNATEGTNCSENVLVSYMSACLDDDEKYATLLAILAITEAAIGSTVSGDSDKLDPKIEKLQTKEVTASFASLFKQVQLNSDDSNVRSRITSAAEKYFIDVFKTKHRTTIFLDDTSDAATPALINDTLVTSLPYSAGLQMFYPLFMNCRGVITVLFDVGAILDGVEEKPAPNDIPKQTSPSPSEPLSEKLEEQCLTNMLSTTKDTGPVLLANEGRSKTVANIPENESENVVFTSVSKDDSIKMVSGKEESRSFFQREHKTQSHQLQSQPMGRREPRAMLNSLSSDEGDENALAASTSQRTERANDQQLEHDVTVVADSDDEQFFDAVDFPDDGVGGVDTMRCRTAPPMTASRINVKESISKFQVEPIPTARVKPVEAKPPIYVAVTKPARRTIERLIFLTRALRLCGVDVTKQLVFVGVSLSQDIVTPVIVDQPSIIVTKFDDSTSTTINQHRLFSADERKEFVANVLGQELNETIDLHLFEASTQTTGLPRQVIDHLNERLQMEQLQLINSFYPLVPQRWMNCSRYILTRSNLNADYITLRQLGVLADDYGITMRSELALFQLFLHQFGFVVSFFNLRRFDSNAETDYALTTLSNTDVVCLNKEWLLKLLTRFITYFKRESLQKSRKVQAYLCHNRRSSSSLLSVEEDQRQNLSWRGKVMVSSILTMNFVNKLNTSRRVYDNSTVQKGGKSEALFWDSIGSIQNSLMSLLTDCGYVTDVDRQMFNTEVLRESGHTTVAKTRMFWAPILSCHSDIGKCDIFGEQVSLNHEGVCFYVNFGQIHKSNAIKTDTFCPPTSALFGLTVSGIINWYQSNLDHIIKISQLDAGDEQLEKVPKQLPIVNGSQFAWFPLIDSRLCLFIENLSSESSSFKVFIHNCTRSRGAMSGRQTGMISSQTPDNRNTIDDLVRSSGTTLEKSTSFMTIDSYDGRSRAVSSRYPSSLVSRDATGRASRRHLQPIVEPALSLELRRMIDSCLRNAQRQLLPKLQWTFSVRCYCGVGQCNVHGRVNCDAERCLHLVPLDHSLVCNEVICPVTGVSFKTAQYQHLFEINDKASISVLLGNTNRQLIPDDYTKASKKSPDDEFLALMEPQFIVPAELSQMMDNPKGNHLQSAVKRGILPLWLTRMCKMMQQPPKRRPQSGDSGTETTQKTTTNWHSLANRLGYDSADMERWSDDCIGSFLWLTTHWIVSSGNTRLSFDVFIAALRAIDRQDVADRVTELFEREQEAKLIRKVKGRSSPSNMQLQPCRPSSLKTRRVVFISYCHRDGAKSARALAYWLVRSAPSLHIWIDVGQISPGENLNAVLSRWILTCVVFIACISPRYITSSSCTRELTLADSCRKPIIPLIVTSNLGMWPPPGPTGLVLAPLAYVDMTGVGSHCGSGGLEIDIRVRYRQIYDQIKRFIGDLPHGCLVDNLDREEKTSSTVDADANKHNADELSSVSGGSDNDNDDDESNNNTDQRSNIRSNGVRGDRQQRGHRTLSTTFERQNHGLYSRFNHSGLVASFRSQQPAERDERGPRRERTNAERRQRNLEELTPIAEQSTTVLSGGDGNAAVQQVLPQQSCSSICHIL